MTPTRREHSVPIERALRSGLQPRPDLVCIGYLCKLVRVTEPTTLGNELLRSAARLSRWASRHASFDVPFAQARLLALLDELGPSRVSALAAADHSSQPTITTQLQRLEASGWVHRAIRPRRRARHGDLPQHRGPRGARERPPGPTGRPVPRPRPARRTGARPRPGRHRRHERAARRRGGHPRSRTPPERTDDHHHVAPTQDRLVDRLRLRDLLHGHRPRRPHPQAHRRRARRRALTGLAALHQLPRRHGHRHARDRLGQQPRRRQAHPAARPRAHHRRRRPRRQPGHRRRHRRLPRPVGPRQRPLHRDRPRHDRQRRIRLGEAGDHPLRGRSRVSASRPARCSAAGSVASRGAGRSTASRSSWRSPSSRP